MILGYLQRVRPFHVLMVVALAFAVFPGFCFASLNVKTDCGAVGNGSTDDTAAFQKCFVNLVPQPAPAVPNKIVVPAGSYLISSTLNLSKGTWLAGEGEGLTSLLSTVSGGPLINLGEIGKVTDMTLSWAGTQPAPQSTTAILFTYTQGKTEVNYFELRNLKIATFYDNIYIDGADNGILSNIVSSNAEHNGIAGNQAQGYWNSVVVVANKNDGIYLGASASHGGGVPPFMSGIQTYGNGGWGIHTVAGIYLGGAENFLNNDSLGELLVDGGSPSDSGHISNADIQFAGQNPFTNVPGLSGYTNVNTAPGIHVTSKAGSVRITDVSVFSNNSTGLWLESSMAQVANVRILGSGQKDASGYCILDASDQSELSNVICNTSSKIATTSSVIRGSHFLSVSSSQPTLAITSGTNTIIADNVIYGGGINNGAYVPALSVSSGVTLARTYNTITGSVSNSGSASANYLPMFP